MWKTIILPHIAARRAALSQPSAPAIVLADAFAAHWTKAVRDLVAARERIAYVAIPDSLTHLFQPLYLGSTAGMKAIDSSTSGRIFAKRGTRYSSGKSSGFAFEI